MILSEIFASNLNPGKYGAYINVAVARQEQSTNKPSTDSYDRVIQERRVTIGDVVQNHVSHTVWYTGYSLKNGPECWPDLGRARPRIDGSAQCSKRGYRDLQAVFTILSVGQTEITQLRYDCGPIIAPWQ